jgi:hypothetical protein
MLAVMPAEVLLGPLLQRQDGLVTLAQAVDLGVSPRTVQRRVHAKQWRRIMPRVFLVAGHPETDAVRVRAAGLWVGKAGAVSGPAAAWWHRMLPTAPRVVDLTVSRDHVPRTPAGGAAAPTGPVAPRPRWDQRIMAHRPAADGSRDGGRDPVGVGVP